jgi:hypothetical protein
VAALPVDEFTDAAAGAVRRQVATADFEIRLAVQRL